MKKLRVCKVIIYCEISKWVKSLLILFGIFAELYNGWRIVDRCRLAQCSCSLILCTFWHLLLIVIFVLLVRWLLVVGCIFTCLEIDIFYTLAFSEKLELLCLRAHWCQRLIWKLKVLSSALLEDRHLCWAHQPVGTMSGHVLERVLWYRLCTYQFDVVIKYL